VPRLAELQPGVLVATSALYLTNTAVIASPCGQCLVVDPGVSVTELAALARELGARGLRPALGFATHAHWDHVLWSSELGEAPRYATAPAAAMAARQREELLRELGAVAAGHDLDLVGRLRGLPIGTVALPWSRSDARLVVHDGHARGHAALHLPACGVLVAGDMCSDVEIPLLDLSGADPLGDYRSGLRLLGALSDVRFVIPGHGHVADGPEFRRRLAADERYLDELEQGRPSCDLRLGDDAMRAEHERQVSALARARR
jgi:hydroxyacylglutathione hydrolase